MVAQIDEQHAAMIALAMHPAGQADALPDVALAKLRRNDGYDRRAWRTAFLYGSL